MFKIVVLDRSAESRNRIIQQIYQILAGYPDCNDADATINPRGSERTPKSNRTDGKDNDCNGVVDG